MTELDPDDDGWNPRAAAAHRRKAKAICGVCPAVDACREWVLSFDNDGDPVEFQVCGGLSIDDRRRARRQRRLDVGDTGRLAERFAELIRVVDNGCHEWTGRVLRGAPYLQVGNDRRRAAVWSWEQASGEVVDPGCRVVQTCGNDLCVNAAHLDAIPRAAA